MNFCNFRDDAAIMKIIGAIAMIESTIPIVFLTNSLGLATKDRVVVFSLGGGIQYEIIELET